jgi:thiamine biosynthesis lipoprotein
MMAPSKSPGLWEAVEVRSAWLLLCLLAPIAQAEWLHEQQSIMGTEVTVTLWHTDKKTGQAAVDAVMAEMRRIDTTYSPWIETSALARVNAQAAQKRMDLSLEFSHLIERSLHYSKISGGAFDITFASVGWYYDYREKKQPTQEQQKSLLPAINYRLLKYDRQHHTLAFDHPNVRIDLGGIAKGYAVDQALGILRRHGITHASVSAGGDSGLLGDRRGRPWLIGIKNPRQQGPEDRDVVLTMPLSDVAVSTSGDYERYFIDEHSGERVHHILNPKTGRSASGVVSVTILGPRGTDTDALSTTLFVLGVTEGLKLLATLPEFDAVIIDAAGKVHYSPGLQPPEPDKT